MGFFANVIADGRARTALPGVIPGRQPGTGWTTTTATLAAPLQQPLQAEPAAPGDDASCLSDPAPDGLTRVADSGRMAADPVHTASAPLSGVAADVRAEDGESRASEPAVDRSVPGVETAQLTDAPAEKIPGQTRDDSAAAAAPLPSRRTADRVNPQADTSPPYPVPAAAQLDGSAMTEKPTLPGGTLTGGAAAGQVTVPGSRFDSRGVSTPEQVTAQPTMQALTTSGRTPASTGISPQTRDASGAEPRPGSRPAGQRQADGMSPDNGSNEPGLPIVTTQTAPASEPAGPGMPQPQLPVNVTVAPTAAAPPAGALAASVAQDRMSDKPQAAAAPAATSQGPRVHIGQLDILVQAPPAPKIPAAPAPDSASLVSRQYLRGL